MHEHFEKLMSAKKCHNSFVTLPSDVVSHFNLTAETYDATKISLSCDNERGMAHFMCYIAANVQRTISRLEKHKSILPENAKMEDFMCHYDELLAVASSRCTIRYRIYIFFSIELENI